MKVGLKFSLAILFAVNALNFYDRHVPGAVAEPVRLEFGLTDTQLGLLNTAFTLVYAVIGVPLGRFSDIWSRKKLLGGGVFIWSLMTAWSGFAGSYAILVASRLGVGIGEATCAPTGSSWIGDLVPAERRARALALFMFGFPLGAALSFFFAGGIAGAFGWRAAMVTAAAPALLLVPALLIMPEPKRGATETGAAAVNTGQGISMWAPFKIPTMWWIILSGTLLNFIMYAIATFLPAMLSRIHGVSVREAGLGAGIAYLFGGVLGLIAASWIGDRIVKARKDGRMLTAAGLALLAAPFAYVGIIQPAGAVVLSVAMLTVAFGTLTSYYGLVYAAIQDVVLPAQRGTTMAVYFFAMYMLGASFGPVVTGRLSDTLAARAAAAAGSAETTEIFRAVGLQQAMLVIPALSVALALVLWMGARTILRDIERRDQLATSPVEA